MAVQNGGLHMPRKHVDELSKLVREFAPHPLPEAVSAVLVHEAKVDDSVDMDSDAEIVRVADVSNMMLMNAALRTVLASGLSTSEHIWKIPVAYTYQVTSSAAGLIATFANNDPSLFGVNWASYATVFNQFRVSRVHVTIHPFYNVSTGAIFFQQVLSCLDVDNATTAPANYQDVLAHADTLDVHDAYRMIRRTELPLVHSSNPRDTWNDTAAPPAGSMAIKFAGFTSLLSTVVWNVTIQWEVEFQGLGA
jgi:hypothetical protein